MKLSLLPALSMAAVGNWLSIPDGSQTILVDLNPHSSYKSVYMEIFLSTNW